MKDRMIDGADGDESGEAPARNVAVAAFGPAAELVGENRYLTLAFPLSGAQIRATVLERFPQLSQHRFSIAVDQKLVQDDQTVASGSEVAILPPFAGG
jgi:molybdopterin converting factor small subunit